MGKRLWDLAKSRFEIATILLGHRHIVTAGAIGCLLRLFTRIGVNRPCW